MGNTLQKLCVHKDTWATHPNGSMRKRQKLSKHKPKAIFSTTILDPPKFTSSPKCLAREKTKHGVNNSLSVSMLRDKWMIPQIT